MAGPEDDDDHADPDPVDQRIDEELDDGLVVVGVVAFEDDVEIILEAGVDGDDGGGLRVVGVDEVDALLGGEAA